MTHPLPTAHGKGVCGMFLLFFLAGCGAWLCNVVGDSLSPVAGTADACCALGAALVQVAGDGAQLEAYAHAPWTGHAANSFTRFFSRSLRSAVSKRFGNRTVCP